MMFHCYHDNRRGHSRHNRARAAMLEVKAQTRQILIYGDIGENPFAAESIVARDIVDGIADLSGDDAIMLRINSYGGSLADAVAIYNALRSHPARVVTQIDGYAYSAASYIAMAGDEVRMADNAMLMIHAPWAGLEGNAADHRQAADTLERHAAALSAGYARAGKVREADVAGWLSGDQDYYFTASEAQSLGLVDTITEGLAVAASANLADLRGRGDHDMSNETTGAQKERARIGEINVALRMASVQVLGREVLDTLRDEAIEDGSTVEQLYLKILNRLPAAEDDGGPVTAGRRRAGGADGSTALGTVFSGTDSADKGREGMAKVLMYRAGLDRSKEMAAEMQQSEFSGYTLSDMARQCLIMRNVPLRGMSRMEMVGRAMSIRGDLGITHTSSDFPALVENIATKAVLRGWEEAPETWRMIARPGTLPDFKEASRAALSAYPSLPPIPESGEFDYVTVADRRNPILLGRFGSIIGLDRTLIVNDDLNELVRISTAQGRAASRTVGDVVYAVITSNAVMGEDGVPIWDAQHNNIATVVGPPSVTTLDDHKKLMAKQTDKNANADSVANVTALNLRIERVLVPLALDTATRVLQSSQTDPNPSVREGIPNPFAGTFQTVSDARLDLVSETAWYSSTNPDSFDFIEAAFLDGAQSPYLESRDGWSVDGVEMKVRIDVGAAPLDFRTSVYNAGE